ncbi:flavoprotein [Nonomuraea sp. MCN248]|uniref:Flavoprotein n=1 Tax=Nonomuraea corallina TaxID=2989783 RepID=A0ABT4SLZ6_9ACTN|nr:flavoprotein [Nonomuraea corallina]MDA0638263.1 flavoprotein [Nonomuraea corallina]
MRELSGVPAFSAERLLVLATGSLGAAFLPYWLNWLRHGYPRLDVRVVLTRSAERFVTRQSVAAIVGKNVPLDVWPDAPEPGSPHVEYASWPDTVLVYPATYHFVSRFAGGLADTPMLLALQCTAAFIGIAPALPPGADRSHAYRGNLDALASRPNVAVAEPVPTMSTHTRERDALAAAPLSALIERVEKLRAEAGA